MWENCALHCWDSAACDDFSVPVFICMSGLCSCQCTHGSNLFLFSFFSVWFVHDSRSGPWPRIHLVSFSPPLTFAKTVGALQAVPHKMTPYHSKYALPLKSSDNKYFSPSSTFAEHFYFQDNRRANPKWSEIHALIPRHDFATLVEHITG